MSDERLVAAVTELAAAIRHELRTELAPVVDGPDRLLSVDAAAHTLGIGRSALYDEIGAGRLRSIKVGRRRLVPSSAIDEFVSSARLDSPGG